MRQKFCESELRALGVSKDEIEDLGYAYHSTEIISDEEFNSYYNAVIEEAKRKNSLSPMQKILEWFGNNFEKFIFIAIGVVICVSLRTCMSCESDKSGWQYHDKNGNKQIQYQGSQEQQRDLEEIDRYFGD